MSTEGEPIPLSAVQHFVFCKRQCALIHLEGLWAENPLTAEGRLLHRAADSGARESRGDLRVSRNLPLRSQRLGLVGRSDVVEWRRCSDRTLGARLAGSDGLWRPLPVEYKRGRPKLHDADRVQLCAQALCLEEMLGVTVPQGALYYGQTRRREMVELDAALRQRTETAARQMTAMLRQAQTPPAVAEPKCRRCSLRDQCRPDVLGKSAAAYLRETVDRIARESW